MTGAILGGSSVQQAAKMQMIIMFMISASTALASIVTTTLVIGVVVDGEHRVRIDRVDDRQHELWRARNWLITSVGVWLKEKYFWVRGQSGARIGGTRLENQGLLG